MNRSREWCCLALAGCASVGLDYAPPRLDMPVGWNQAEDTDTITTASPDDIGRWWKRLGDPLLARLVEEALEASPGMRLLNSYSSKANPWDNACIESFHSLIKREWLNRFRIRDIEHAHRLVFEYIDMFYNTRRIHSYCGYLSPFAYETQYYRTLLFAQQAVA